jgi:hypothetical protein
MAGMLQDGEGNTSSMRVMMVATVLTGCVVAILGVVLGRSGVEIAALVGALLIPAFGGKAIQSRAGQ